MSGSFPLWKKIVTGGPDYKISRLHDEKGHFISLKNVLLHGPRALASGLIRLGLGIRPKMPWIAYGAIKKIDQLLTRDCAVLEFGSGMSTQWLAKRAGHVLSIEHDQEWYGIVRKVILRGQKNVEVFFARNKKDYIGLNDRPKTGFDLIIVDGIFRDECVKRSLGLLRPGGAIYLDNTDRTFSPEGDEMRSAEKILLAYSKKMGAKNEYFVDFAPAQLFVQEGLLVQLPLAQRRRRARSGKSTR